jgi:hypothetical protein
MTEIDMDLLAQIDDQMLKDIGVSIGGPPGCIRPAQYRHASERPRGSLAHALFCAGRAEIASQQAVLVGDATSSGQARRQKIRRFHSRL